MINVEKLRSKIEEKIALDRAEHEKQLFAWNRFLGDHKAAWNEKWGKAWLESTIEISRTITDGGVVTQDMLPGRHSGEWTYSVPFDDAEGNRRPASRFVVPMEFRQVLDALDLLDEKEVSHTALARVGINQTVMVRVSRYLSGYRR